MAGLGRSRLGRGMEGAEGMEAMIRGAIPPGMSRERVIALVRAVETTNERLALYCLSQGIRRRGNTWGMWRASR